MLVVPPYFISFDILIFLTWTSVNIYYYFNTYAPLLPSILIFVHFHLTWTLYKRRLFTPQIPCIWLRLYNKFLYFSIVLVIYIIIIQSVELLLSVLLHNLLNNDKLQILDKLYYHQLDIDYLYQLQFLSNILFSNY